MAKRLYPPVLGGTLPSCYEYPEGTVTLTVPFSMNKTVGSEQVGSFMIRVKTTSTDRLVIEQEVPKQGIMDAMFCTLKVSLPAAPFKHYSIGTFFKVQLAYNNIIDGTPGYYSSLAIIKYTSKPEVTISSLKLSTVNMDQSQYIGEYYNKDSTEVVAQYKFLLYDIQGHILEDSGWRNHNSYVDSRPGTSNDVHKLRTALKTSETYRIQYKIMTNNGLEVASDKYLLSQSNLVTPEVTVTINANMDEDNGCVQISLLGDIDPKTGQEYVTTGMFVISRASSTDNYATWLDILHFSLIGDFPSNFKFNDFTVEHGESYRYSFQQYNNFGVYSARILSHDVKVVFEDAFLFDGERQLRIRYNPKISSFKTSLLDSKKTTVGGKYPIFFRNGNVEYKEFPISGLVTYFTDNDEFFFKKKEIGFSGWENTTDIIDSNIYLERHFKLSVLDWLNDGRVKMFKSPQEGNYIVRISNVTMTPNDSLSRMLHTFNCTATEIADFTTESLEKYNLIHTTIEPRSDLKWRSVDLHEWIQNRIQTYMKWNGMSAATAIETAKRDMINYDFAEGKSVYYFKIESADAGLKVRTGITDERGKRKEILIGSTGYYEASFESPFQGLSISSYEIIDDNEANAVPIVIGPNMSGILTYAIASTTTNTFDSINQIRVNDIVCRQFFGPNEDLLKEWNDLRLQVQRIYYAHFVQKQYEELVLPVEYKIDEFNKFLEAIENPLNVFYYPENGVNTYYYYTGTNIVKVGVDRVQVQDYLERIIPNLSAKEIQWYKLKKYQVEFSQAYTQGLWNFINAYSIYHRKEQIGDKYIDKYYIFDEIKRKFVEVEGYDTSIDFGDSHLDVADIGEIWIPDLETVPKKIRIGNGVYAEIGFTYRILSYSAEDKCFYPKYTWLLEEQKYRAAKQGLALAGNISYTGTLSSGVTHTQAEVLYNQKTNGSKVHTTPHECFAYDIETFQFFKIPEADKKLYWHRPIHNDFKGSDGNTVWTPIYYYPQEDDTAVPTQEYIDSQYRKYRNAYQTFLTTLTQELAKEEELRA